MTKDFKRLRELEAKRTQGEWEWSSHGDPVVFDLEEPSFGYLYPKGSEGGPYSIIETDCNVYGPNAIDAQWIAECSIQLPNLLKRIDALEKENYRLHALVDEPLVKLEWDTYKTTLDEIKEEREK